MKHKFYSRPEPSTAPSVSSPPPDDAAGSSFDVESLLAKCGVILHREVMNLMSKSSGGKLPPADARDLATYVKLLSELKKEQAETLANLTPEELKALAAKD